MQYSFASASWDDICACFRESQPSIDYESRRPLRRLSKLVGQISPRRRSLLSMHHEGDFLIPSPHRDRHPRQVPRYPTLGCPGYGNGTVQQDSSRTFDVGARDTSAK